MVVTELMHKLTVAKKLALGFGLVVLMLAVQSISGFISSGESQALLKTTIAQGRLKEELSVTLGEATLREELLMREMSVSIDTRELDLLTKNLQQVRVELNDAVDRLKRSELDQAENALIDEVAELTRSSQGDRQQVEALLLKLQTDQANSVYEEKLRKLDANRRELVLKFSTRQREKSNAAFGIIEKLIEQARIAIVLSALIGVLVAAIAGRVIYRSITKPLNEVVYIADRVADGDLTVDIHAGEARTEIADMLRALARMAENMKRSIQAIYSSSETIMVASSEIAAGNGDLSTRTEEQASSLQTAVSSMEQLTESVRRTADAAKQASTLAAEASRVASDAGERVNGLDATMGAISRSSTEMADIVGVIDGIAFQTNILALNAAVEAARAGEQGRGFAVVAAEVRSLAQRSAEAAKEIKIRIEDNLATVADGAGLVGSAGATIRHVVKASEAVFSVMSEITAATQKQAENVTAIHHAIMDIDRGVQQNAALVEQSAAASESLKAQAEALNGAVQQFKLP